MVMRLSLSAIAVAAVVGFFAVNGGANTAHAPAACIDAIAQARQVTGRTVQALSDVQPLFSMVRDAAKAGLTQNTSQLYVIAAKLTRINSQLTTLNHEVIPAIARFNADALSCR